MNGWLGRQAFAMDEGVGPGLKSNENKRDDGQDDLEAFGTALFATDFALAPLG